MTRTLEYTGSRCAAFGSQAVPVLESVCLAVWFAAVGAYVTAEWIGSAVLGLFALLAVWHRALIILQRDLRLHAAVITAAGVLFQGITSGDLWSWAMVLGALWLLVMRQGMLYQTQWQQRLLPVSVRVALLFTLFAAGLVNTQGGNGSSFQLTLLQFWCAAFVLMARPVVCVNRYWLLFAVALMIALSLSNLLAAQQPDVVATWYRVWAFAGHLAFVWAIGACVMQQPFRLWHLLMPVLLALLVLVVVYVNAWYQMDDPRGYDWFSYPPMFNHIRHNGYFLCVAASAALLWLFYSPLRVRPIAFALFVLAFSFLFWNGGRGAILAVFCTLPVLVLAFGLRQRWATWGLVVIGIAVSLWLSHLYQVDQRGVGWYSAWLRSEQADNLNALSSSRLWIWMQLLEPIQQRLLLGWGGDGFETVWPVLSISQAHNGLFQLLIEWGLIGTTLVLGGVLYIYLRGSFAFIRGERAELQVAGLVFVTALLALAVVDGVFYYATPGLYLALGLGLCIRR